MSKERDKVIRELLDFDPLSEANRLTGQETSSEETSSLGFLLLHQQASQLAGEMREADDTYQGTDYQRFSRIAEEEGFSFIRDEPYGDDNARKTIFFKYDEGLLLVVTHNFMGGEQVDVAELTACWEPFKQDADDMEYWEIARYFSWSAARREDVLVAALQGHVQDGLRFKLRELREHGKFWPKWECSFPVDVSSKYPSKSKDRLEALRSLPKEMLDQIGIATLRETEMQSLGID